MVQPRSPQLRSPNSSIVQYLSELLGIGVEEGKYTKERQQSSFIMKMVAISCSIFVVFYFFSYFSMFHVLHHDAAQNSNGISYMNSALQKLAMNKNRSDIEIAVDIANKYKEPASVGAVNDDLKDNHEHDSTDKKDLQIAIDAAASYTEPLPIVLENNNGKQVNSKGKLQQQDVLVLTTKVGVIRIVLRPDLSQDSVTYLKILTEPKTSNRPCSPCNIYRAEKPGILQGIMQHPSISTDFIQKGSCPVGYEHVQNDCPEWDSNCKCHGPIMTHGMVGWAAGATGPDFFINTYKQPAKWWGTQHTVFGIIMDEQSFTTIDTIYNTIPTHEVEGLTHINDPIHISLSLENVNVTSSVR